MDLQEEAITLLAEVLKAHGYPTQRTREWLLIDPSRPPALSAAVLVRSQDEGLTFLQLDIRVLFPGMRIVESFGGRGRDKRSALVDAFANFANNSLHVILAAFWNPEDNQVTTQMWEIGGNSWRAVIGNCGFRTFGFEGPVTLPDTVYSDLVERVQTRVQAEPGQIHWFRFYYANYGEEPVYEVLFDNDPWPEAQDAMALLPWDTTRLYSARGFTILHQIAP